MVAAKRISAEERPAVLDENTLVVLTGLVREEDGEKTLEWTAPEDGSYELFSFWLHGTGQTASPSAGTSYTVNYIDRYGVEALIDY